MKELHISIIIPVYNEENNIESLYEELLITLEKLKQSSEVIFVEDGSTDSTLERLKKISMIKTIVFQKNFGQTAAFDAGLKEARGDIIITMDGDGQNDPKDIPALLEKLNQGYDIVCGWRRFRKDPFLAKLMSKIGRFIRIFLFDDKIHDSGCSLRAYKKEAVQNLDLYGEMHRYISTIIMLRGFNVGEVEVSHRPRIHGKSKYRWQKNIKGFMDMVNLWFLYKYRARPLHLFGGLGILISGVGLTITIYFAYIRLFLDVPIADRVLPIAGMFMILFGIQLFVTGMLADILVRNYYSTSKEKSYFIKEIINANGQ